MENRFQLELVDLVKDYKGFRAVNKINIQLKKGEILSLLGPSGCGKTTTLRMVAGLLPPTEGRVILAGKDITNNPPYKRDIAMVFQNYALFPHMTVFDNVVYGLRNHGVRDKETLKKKAQEVLSIVQLEGVEKRYPRQLSGGQQQRVSLARAMAVEPQIMLFDEPLSNLDAKLRVQTRIEIRNLLKQLNITAVYVTHDQEEALTISDYVAVMNKGHIEQLATPHQLYDVPESCFVADFIGQANLLKAQVVALDGQTATVKLHENMILHCPCTADLKVGDERTVLIRPENIHLMPKESGNESKRPNVFDATIEEKNFLGSVTRYKVCLFGEMHVACEYRSGKAFADVGGQVTVEFEESKIVLIDPSK